jgi:hypothetical protein
MLDAAISIETEFEVTNCDLKLANSSTVNWIKKSEGNLSRFRLTAWTKTLVSTP